MTAKFSILDRIRNSRARITIGKLSKESGHLLCADEFIALAKEASDQPCQVVASHRHDGHHDIIEVLIVYQAEKVSE